MADKDKSSPQTAPKSGPTRAVTAEIGTDVPFKAVTPPLYMTSTYNWLGFEQKGPYDYGRTVNPNRAGLASALCDLEGGAGGVVTASGMAAIDLVFNLFQADDLIVAPHDCYGGTHRLLTHRALQGRLRVEFVDQGDEAALSAALALKPKLVLIETPSNPLMRIIDVRAICKQAHAAGAKVICDNTFLSPARMQPIALGCDIVVHSTTKYINGHSDVVGGVAIAKDSETAEQLAWWANCCGLTGSPFDSYQTLRGLRTLYARMDIQEAHAVQLAKFLQNHPKVAHVYYPGLASDPGYKLMQAQQSGPGAMLSFELKGNKDSVGRFLASLKLYQLAASLGGIESLICHPATMTHRGMSDEAMEIAGIKESLIRISVGMEQISDQIADLETAFSET